MKDFSYSHWIKDIGQYIGVQIPKILLNLHYHILYNF